MIKSRAYVLGYDIFLKKVRFSISKSYTLCTKVGRSPVTGLSIIFVEF